MKRSERYRLIVEIEPNEFFELARGGSKAELEPRAISLSRDWEIPFFIGDMYDISHAVNLWAYALGRLEFTSSNQAYVKPLGRDYLSSLSDVLLVERLVDNLALSG